MRYFAALVVNTPFSIFPFVTSHSVLETACVCEAWIGAYAINHTRKTRAPSRPSPETNMKRMNE